MVLGIGAWIGITAGVIVLGSFVYYYNKFVLLDNRVKNSLAQIDVQLRKRADLVPALIKVVKAFAKHESKIMESVTKARVEMLKQTDIAAKVKAGDKLQNALKSIFAIAENYPDLKSNTNYLQLQEELASLEDRVAYSRQFYNDNILSYDNASQKFPGVLFYKLYGRKAHEYLKIPEASRAMPKIDL